MKTDAVFVRKREQQFPISLKCVRGKMGEEVEVGSRKMGKRSGRKPERNG